MPAREPRAGVPGREFMRPPLGVEGREAGFGAARVSWECCIVERGSAGLRCGGEEGERRRGSRCAGHAFEAKARARRRLSLSLFSLVSQSSQGQPVESMHALAARRTEPRKHTRALHTSRLPVMRALWYNEYCSLCDGGDAYLLSLSARA